MFKSISNSSETANTLVAGITYNPIHAHNVILLKSARKGLNYVYLRILTP